MVFVIHWAHILSVFRITHSQKHKYPSVEELMCTHNTHTLIITLLVFHRHLEKHKEGDLNPNPEMIFPPVTITTKFVCKSLLYMCACLCWRPHAKGFHGRHPEVLGGGGVPRLWSLFQQCCHKDTIILRISSLSKHEGGESDKNKGNDKNKSEATVHSQPLGSALYLYASHQF